MIRFLPLLAALLLGCGSSPPATADAPAPAAEPAPDEAPAAPAVTPAPPGEPSTVLVQFEAESAPASGTVTIAGVPYAQLAGGWIEWGSRPTYWWSKSEVSTAEPLEASLPLPVGLHYFAILSVNGDDVPDPGDFVGGPLPHRVSGRELVLHVDRPFGSDLGKRPADAAPAVEVVTQTLDALLTLDGATAPEGTPSVIVLGHLPAESRYDEADSAPSYFFQTVPAPRTWPLTIALPLPIGLDVQLVVDVDGDGKPGKADLASDIVPGFRPPSDGSPAAFPLVGAFKEPTRTATAVTPAPPGPDGGPERTGGDLQALTLTSDVDLAFVKAGRILVAGYEPGQEVIPGPATLTPSFLWTSEQLRLEWPLQIGAPMPEGLDVLVVLDLDGSGAVDGGDLSTKVLATWSPSVKAQEHALSEVVPPAPGGVPR